MFWRMNKTTQATGAAGLAAVLILLCGAASASPADSEFEALAQEYLADLPKFSPVNATLIGDHSADACHTSTTCLWTRCHFQCQLYGRLAIH